MDTGTTIAVIASVLAMLGIIVGVVLFVVFSENTEAPPMTPPGSPTNIAWNYDPENTAGKDPVKTPSRTEKETYTRGRDTTLKNFRRNLEQNLRATPWGH